MPIPKINETKIDGLNNINVSWDIEKFNNININKEEIKYIVEIRKENDKFYKVYEGKNKNCLINNLLLNTNYELRISSSFNNNLKGGWSKIHNIKTKDVDSNILKESKRENELFQKIMEWTGYKDMELLYRGTRDGSTGKDFHSKCNNKVATITLFK